MNPAFDIVGTSIVTRPTSTFVVLDEGSWTYGEFGALVDRYCHAMRALGIGAGDAVGYYVGNRIASLVTYFGSFKLGVMVVPLNPMLRAAEIAHIVNDAGIRVLVADNQDAEMRGSLVEVRTRVGEQVRLVGLIDGPEVDAVWDDLLAAQPGEPVDAAVVSPDDVACLVYTSGTTGTPKGSTTTHGNLFHTTQTYFQAFRARPSDIVLTAMPMFTGFAPWFIVQPMAQAGATIVMHQRFDAARMLADLEVRRATCFFGVPTMYSMLLAEVDRTEEARDFSTMRLLGTSGARMAVELAQRAEQLFGCQLGETYGQTETGPVAINLLAPDNPVGSVGRAPGAVDLAIMSPDGVLLPAGETGEIVVRSYMCTPGYWHQPEQTEALWAHDWLHTGDTGYLDERGFLYTVDRVKNLIITGGMNIYPAEVEAMLLTHPAVLHAAVVPKADDTYGELPVAFLVLKEGHVAEEQEIIDFCRANMAKYKAPRVVRFLDEMPISPIGKILRRELVAEA
jgi:long-chain acyl-CoA synthetase